MADDARWKKAESRLNSGRARNIWFGSVRADGSPHLVPLWFVWHERKVWVGVGRGTQKHLNIQRNPHVVVALEDGTSPVIVEGVAREEDSNEAREALALLFVDKYDWDFRTDSDEDWLLVSVEPNKLLTW